MRKIAGLLIVLLWVACKDKSRIETLSTPSLRSYFPLKTGKYITYAVDSTRYDGFYTPTKVIQAHYNLKEIVADSFFDANQQLSYRIERYRRNTDTGNWSIDGVSFATIYTGSVERVDDNLRFIKLAAPINFYTQWLGNAHINTATGDFTFLDNWMYQYTAIDEPATLNGLTFAKTLTVKQFDAEDAIQKRVGYEKYAQGVGLIYKQYTYLNNFSSDTTLKYPAVGWPDRAKDGFNIIMTVKDHN